MVQTQQGTTSASEKMSLRWKHSSAIIFGNIFRKYIFLILRFFFLVMQRVVWKLNGVQDIVYRNWNPAKSGDCPVAHRMNIVAAYKGCHLLPGSLRDFILSHDAYVDPMYVTQHDNISLFFIDQRSNLVVFAEGLPDQLLWKTKCDPILVLSQYKHAQKLIIMQMSEFRRVCNALPDPKKPLVIMGNTARCGSTLLTQVFEETGNVITTSECYPMNTIAYKFKTDGMTEEVIGLTRDMIRYYCRPIHALPDPAGYLLKPTGPSSSLSSVVKKLYPDVTIFYLYRNMDNVAKSMFKLSFFLPSMRMFYFMARLSGAFLAEAYRIAMWPEDPKRRKFNNDHSFSIFQAVMATGTYNEMHKEDEGVHGLLFDDIIKDKVTAVKAIFKVCGLSEDLVKPALNAFHKDSQSDSLISAANFAKIKNLEVTEEDRKESNEILVECGFPPLDQDTRLPGTLDFEKVLEES